MSLKKICRKEHCEFEQGFSKYINNSKTKHSWFNSYTTKLVPCD